MDNKGENVDRRILSEQPCTVEDHAVVVNTGVVLCVGIRLFGCERRLPGDRCRLELTGFLQLMSTAKKSLSERTVWSY